MRLFLSPRQRTLAVLCLASAAWAVSFGVGAPLAALRLQDAGLSHRTLGLNTSVYYLGVAVAAPFVPVLIRRGGRQCMVLGMLVDGLSVALFPATDSVLGWFMLRLLGGIATALCLIPMETLVGHNALPGRRAADFGVYAFCVALGVGIGPVLGVPLYAWSPSAAFALGGAAAIAGALLLAWALPDHAAAAESPCAGERPPLRECAMSLGAAWVQGFIEGGMMTFLAVYLLGLGYGEAGASALIGTLFVGVVLFQLPLAWLADRCGLRRLLLACQGVVAAGLAALTVCRDPLSLAFWLFAVGACCAALYPLGLALLGWRVPSAGLATANAWYLACNCAGSLSGPVLVGWAMDHFGGAGLFGAGLAALLIAVALGQIAERRPAARPQDVAVRRAA